MSLDLETYLARVDLPRAAVTSPSLATLDALIWAHVRHVPFENLDILLDVPIRIDLPNVNGRIDHFSADL